jgi:hypothetical protein
MSILLSIKLFQILQKIFAVSVFLSIQAVLIQQNGYFQLLPIYNYLFYR